MTQVRIQSLISDASESGTADLTVAVRLVDAAQRHTLIGLRASDGAPVTAYATATLAAGNEALVVELTPTSDIATPDGSATWYLIELRAAHRAERYAIQVPDSDAVLDLIDLVGASAIDPPAQGLVAMLEHLADTTLHQPAPDLTELLEHLSDTDLHLPGAPRWDDLRAPASTINPVGSAAPPTAAEDGSLLFGASGVDQIACLFQLPHAWAGTDVHPHIHWSKTSDAAGDVVWELRHRVWDTGQPAPAWSEWAAPASRSEPVAADQRMLIDAWAAIDMDGLGASCMLSLELRRAGDDGADTYGADARLWEMDCHYQLAGFGSADEYPSA